MQSRSRHVSFESDLDSLSTQQDNLSPISSRSRTFGILKSPTKSSMDKSNIELVRNEYSDSPIFVRKHQVENFQRNGVRMSITSLCESVEGMSKQTLHKHHHSTNTLGSSYTCLPAVTLPIAKCNYNIEEHGKPLKPGTGWLC